MQRLTGGEAREQQGRRGDACAPAERFLPGGGDTVARSIKVSRIGLSLGESLVVGRIDRTGTVNPRRDAWHRRATLRASGAAEPFELHQMSDNLSMGGTPMRLVASFQNFHAAALLSK